MTEQQENYENKEDIKIKDLLNRIAILKQGVISERQRCSEMEKEIKKHKEVKEHLERLLNEKENAIMNLSKEKYEIQSKLDIEKTKLEATNNANSSSFMNLFRRNSQNTVSKENDQESKRLLNENVEMKKELESYKMKYEEKCQEFENVKNEYQALINLQTEKIKKHDSVIAEKNKQHDEVSKKLAQMFDNWKAIDVERVKLENKYFDLQKECKQKDEKILFYENALVDKVKKIEFYEESLKRQARESAELANKLAELKNAIIDNNMVVHNFKGEKLGTFFNTSLEITFGRTDDNIYALVIHEGDNAEYVNVEDIDYFKLNEKYETAIDLCYFKNGKPIKMTLLFLEPVDKIQKVYHDYLQKSIMAHHYMNNK